MANTAALQKLDDSTHMVFQAVDSGEKRLQQLLDSETQARAQLGLRCNAQVMCIKNLDDEVTNGTIGVVIDFFTAAELEMCALDLDEPWPGSSPESCPPPPPARNPGDVTPYPFVRFELSTGKTILRHCVPEKFTVEEVAKAGDVHVVRTATRRQVPLVLAWAVSIHKSQGLSFHHVVTDIRHCFEAGQVYVALSRATAPEGLQVVGWSRQGIISDEEVLAFYEGLRPARLAARGLPGKTRGGTILHYIRR